MTAAPKPKSDTVLIKDTLGQGEKASDFLKQLKALTDDDKAQLAGGIRDGSMTY